MRGSVFLAAALILTVSAWPSGAEAIPVGGDAGAVQGADKPPNTTQPAGEMIQLQFPENVEVKILIDYVSKRLGLNILYDDKLVHRRVTISSPVSIPKASLPGLLDSVLKMAGLALVDGDQPGWKRIVEDRDMLSLVRTFGGKSGDTIQWP